MIRRRRPCDAGRRGGAAARGSPEFEGAQGGDTNRFASAANRDLADAALQASPPAGLTAGAK